jgi:hypothetical protein
MYSFGAPPSKPIAPTSYDENRWTHSALRRRLLQGNWEQDLEDELYRHIPADRREAWGAADMSSNVFEQTVRQLSVLYHETPIVVNSNGDIAQLVERDGITDMAGLWPLMQRMQQYVLGMRESIIRIDVTPHVIDGPAYQPGVQYRIVTPDFVICDASPDDPDRPTMYHEYRLRQYNDKVIWVVDVLDIRDPERPYFGMYRVNEDGTLGDDMSEIYMGHPTHVGLTGDNAYPYIDSNGRPFLPIVLYHAEKTGQLFNAYDQSQLVFGSLQAAVFFSFYSHLLKDASWPQKYAVGVTLQGLSALDQDVNARRLGITTDPSSILMFQPTDDTQPQLGQFQPGADVHSMLESIAKYEYRVATSSGISPAELQRTSGDPRSGYALAISRQGQREAQRKYAPVFRMADEELMRKTAILSNRFLGTSLPETGYRVSYQSLPMSADEMKGLREDITEKLANGLISPVQAIKMLNPDLSDEAAKEELVKIRVERAEFM